MFSSHLPTLAVIGGGPAGLMAAETARAAGVAVHVYDAMGSVGRKFLVAGKGGLNLTHSDPFDVFVSRYGGRAIAVESWLRAFDADALREWARDLGVETFVGSSGRVFPSDLKAAPLLRGWLRRLRAQGVVFRMHHKWKGWSESGAWCFDVEGESVEVHADASVLALGGASWPVLGSDGAWVEPLRARGADVAPLLPANCGFDVGWSEHLAQRFAGAPLKPVALIWRDHAGHEQRRQGECVLTAGGIEGSLIYAASAALRDEITRCGKAVFYLDLAPAHRHDALLQALSKPRQGRSLAGVLKRVAGIEGAKVALLHERVAKADLADASKLAAAIKALPIAARAARPVEEAISSAGGVRLEALDEHLMLRSMPGLFCAGEMLDWEAPTGGYLLTACFASGRIAGLGAANWLLQRGVA
jgi:uncharacterized flavoprotein (TIGR03862 family)